MAWFVLTMIEDSYNVPSSSLDQSSENTKVRHAGKAHIRGKIRRVWRPRFLELLDNGLVRYYELPNSKHGNTGEEMDSYLLKCVISITGGSRILDGTTLRDMHVGLPRGSYGFVFRGQKIASFDEKHRAAVSEMSSSYVTNLLSPTMSSAHDDLQYSSCLGNPIESDPRDFLCAVATLEEAQMWVVALQWAASPVSRSSVSPWWASPQSTPDIIFTSKKSNDHQLPVVESNRDLESYYSSRESWPSRSAIARDVAASFPDDERNSKINSVKLPRMVDTSSSTLQGEVVVSKVVRYKTVRTRPGVSFQFEIAYEIHCLLVELNDTDDNLQKLGAKEAKSVGVRHRYVAEQWSMYRTADDFRTLITNLCKELGPSLLDRAQLGPIKQLPRWINKPTPFELQNSLSIVDSILRSLVMDVAMVNAQAMKAFLGLLNDSTKEQARLNDFDTIPILSSLPFWKLHDPEIVITRSPVAVSEDMPVDHFVKQWLISRTAIASAQKIDVATFLLQRPLWIACGIGFTTFAGGPMSRFLGHHYSCNMPTITIRLDFLVASWMGAACLGARYLENDMMKSIWISNSDDEKVLKEKLTSENRSDTLRSSNLAYSNQSNNDMQNKNKQVQAPYVASSLPAMNRAKEAVLSHGFSSNTVPTPNERDEESSSSGIRDGNEDDEDDGVILSAGELIGESDGNNDVCSTDDDDSVVATPFENEVVAGVLVGPFYYQQTENHVSSPLPRYHPDTAATTSWSQPSVGNMTCEEHSYPVTFYVRGEKYLHDKVKIPSGAPALKCRGVDLWITDNPERHIARHPAMLGGKLQEKDTFLVNFLLPFGNFVAYFEIPPLSEFPNDKIRNVWSKFINGDQLYRDARLKLLPVVVEGPWIVKTAVGPGKSPALLGKVIPLQYFFRFPNKIENDSNAESVGDGTAKKGIFEVDVIITASTIAKGILSIVKGHTQSVSLAFAFIIEGSKQDELPETVLCSCQIHSVHLEKCPLLPPCNLDEIPF